MRRSKRPRAQAARNGVHQGGGSREVEAAGRQIVPARLSLSQGKRGAEVLQDDGLLQFQSKGGPTAWGLWMALNNILSGIVCVMRGGLPGSGGQVSCRNRELQKGSSLNPSVLPGPHRQTVAHPASTATSEPLHIGMA